MGGELDKIIAMAFRHFGRLDADGHAAFRRARWNVGTGCRRDPFIGFSVKNLQSGQASHTNYATSYEVLKNVRVGFNGYWLQQLTDRQINSKDVQNSKERAVGLGPGYNSEETDCGLE